MTEISRRRVRITATCINAVIAIVTTRRMRQIASCVFSRTMSTRMRAITVKIVTSVCARTTFTVMFHRGPVTMATDAMTKRRAQAVTTHRRHLLCQVRSTCFVTAATNRKCFVATFQSTKSIRSLYGDGQRLCICICISYINLISSRVVQRVPLNTCVWNPRPRLFIPVGYFQSLGWITLLHYPKVIESVHIQGAQRNR